MIYDYLTTRKRGRWYYQLDGTNDSIKFDPVLLRAGESISFKFKSPAPSGTYYIADTSESLRMYCMVKNGVFEVPSSVEFYLDGVLGPQPVPTDDSVHEIKLVAKTDRYIDRIGSRYSDTAFGLFTPFDIVVPDRHLWRVDDNSDTIKDHIGSNDAVAVGFNAERWVYLQTLKS